MAGFNHLRRVSGEFLATRRIGVKSVAPKFEVVRLPHLNVADVPRVKGSGFGGGRGIARLPGATALGDSQAVVAPLCRRLTEMAPTSSSSYTMTYNIAHGDGARQ